MLAEEENSLGADLVMDLAAINGWRIKRNPFIQEQLAPFGRFIQENVMACAAGDKSDCNLFDLRDKNVGARFMRNGFIAVGNYDIDRNRNVLQARQIKHVTERRRHHKNGQTRASLYELRAGEKSIELMISSLTVVGI